MCVPINRLIGGLMQHACNERLEKEHKREESRDVSRDHQRRGVRVGLLYTSMRSRCVVVPLYPPHYHCVRRLLRSIVRFAQDAVPIVLVFSGPPASELRQQRRGRCASGLKRAKLDRRRAHGHGASRRLLAQSEGGRDRDARAMRNWRVDGDCGPALMGFDRVEL